MSKRRALVALSLLFSTLALARPAPASAEMTPCTWFTPWWCSSPEPMGPDEGDPRDTNGDGYLTWEERYPSSGGSPSSSPEQAPAFSPYQNPGGIHGNDGPNGNVQTTYTDLGMQKWPGKVYDSAISSAPTNLGSVNHGAGSNQQSIVAWVTLVSDSDFVLLRLPPTTGCWCPNWGLGSGGPGYSQANTAGVTEQANAGFTTVDGKLHMIGVTTDGGTVRMYVDGVLRSTTAMSSVSWDVGMTTTMHAGAHPWNGSSLQGQVWDPAIKMGPVLTDTQMKAIWDQGKVGVVEEEEQLYVEPETAPQPESRPADSTHTDDTSSPFSTLANRISTYLGNLGDRLMSGFTWLGKYIAGAVVTLGNRLVENLGKLHGALTTGLTWVGQYLKEALLELQTRLLQGLRAVTLTLWHVAGLLVELPARLMELVITNLAPSQASLDSLKQLYDGVRTKAPFSWGIDVATFIPNALNEINAGIPADGCISIFDLGPGDAHDGVAELPGANVPTGASTTLCPDNGGSSLSGASGLFAALAGAFLALFVLAGAFGLYRTIVWTIA